MDEGERRVVCKAWRSDYLYILPHLKTAVAWSRALAVRLGQFRYKMLCAIGIHSKNVSICFTLWHCSLLLCETVKKREKTLPGPNFNRQMPYGSLDLSAIVGVSHGQQSQWFKPRFSTMLETTITLFPVFQQSEFVLRIGSHVIYFHTPGRNEMLHQVLPIWSAEGEHFTLPTNIANSCHVTQNNYWPNLFQSLFVMRHNQMLTDVRLEVVNEVFHAHKIVMAAASPYFKGI